MKNFIGQIHDTRKLSQAQIDSVKGKIKQFLQLDTVEISSNGSEFYDVSTDDSNIVDFKIDEYSNDELSLVKYRNVDDLGKTDKYGAILTVRKISIK